MARGDIGQRIRQKRETYRGVGMTQTELAKRIGLSSSQRLSQWESGKHDPQPPSIVNRIAEVLETTVEYLLHGSQIMATRAEPTGKVKVYGPISAGHGNVADVDWTDIEVPIQFARDDFGALMVDGDSMMPFLHHSDIVIFHDWPQVKANHVVAACLEDGSWVVKLARWNKDHFELASLNPSYEPIQGPFRIGGYLVGFVRDEGPERLIRLNPYGLKP